MRPPGAPESGWERSQEKNAVLTPSGCCQPAGESSRINAAESSSRERECSRQPPSGQGAGQGTPKSALQPVVMLRCHRWWHGLRRWQKQGVHRSSFSLEIVCV